MVSKLERNIKELTFGQIGDTVQGYIRRDRKAKGELI